jgi:hypothetical protein
MRTLSALPQAMRLRRAVPQIPAKSSVPPRSPLDKNRFLPTHSESTLLQVLIPLHFNSFISNTYKKPGGGIPPPSPKFDNSSLANCRSLAHTQTPLNPFPLMRLLHNSLYTPGVQPCPIRPHRRVRAPVCQQRCSGSGPPMPTRVTLLARCSTQRSSIRIGWGGRGPSERFCWNRMATAPSSIRGRLRLCPCCGSIWRRAASALRI